MTDLSPRTTLRGVGWEARSARSAGSVGSGSFAWTVSRASWASWVSASRILTSLGRRRGLTEEAR